MAIYSYIWNMKISPQAVPLTEGQEYIFMISQCRFPKLRYSEFDFFLVSVLTTHRHLKLKFILKYSINFDNNDGVRFTFCILTRLYVWKSCHDHEYRKVYIHAMKIETKTKKYTKQIQEKWFRYFDKLPTKLIKFFFEYIWGIHINICHGGTFQQRCNKN